MGVEVSGEGLETIYFLLPISQLLFRALLLLVLWGGEGGKWVWKGVGGCRRGLVGVGGGWWVWKG